MKEAFITGASGFIGARVARRLLESGWTVHAAGRRKNGQSWPQRMMTALEGIDDSRLAGSAAARLQCYCADLARPDLGITKSVRDELVRSRLTVFHVAGDTRFTAADPEEHRRINVDSGPNVLRILGPAVERFVHVSTAYVAGNRRGIVRETDLDVGQTFHNCYEANKLGGELRMLDMARAQGTPLIILRPSIVINDSKTGRSSASTHFNALIELIGRLQQHHNLGYGEVAGPELRILAMPDSRANVIPVDVVVEALLRIARHPRAGGKVYHLCHPSPQTNGELIELVLEALGIRGKLAMLYVNKLGESSYTEKMILRAFRPYLEYLNNDIRFDLTNTRSIIPEYDSLFSTLDADYMRRVMHAHSATSQVAQHRVA